MIAIVQDDHSLKVLLAEDLDVVSGADIVLMGSVHHRSCPQLACQASKNCGSGLLIEGLARSIAKSKPLPNK